MTFCNACGAQLSNEVRYCPKCGAVQSSAVTIQAAPANAGPMPTASLPPAPARVVMVAAKEPWLAVVLSFLFAGLGQIYNGEINKGIAFIVAHIVSLLLIMVLVGIVTTPIIWIWGMIDAYNSAQRINRGIAAGAAA